MYVVAALFTSRGLLGGHGKSGIAADRIHPVHGPETRGSVLLGIPHSSGVLFIRGSARGQPGRGIVSVVDYVKTPFMACPVCGSDPGWETKSREYPQCEDLTVREVMSESGEEMNMVGDCASCGLFFEVRVTGQAQS